MRIIGNHKKRLFGCCLGALFLLAGANNAGAAPAWSDAEDAAAVRAKLAELLGTQMRLPGSDANLALEQKVMERFAATGLESGSLKFTAPSFQPGEAVMRTEAGEFEIHPMHPSLFRPGNFTERYFETELLDLGSGSPEDLHAARGIDLDGKLLLMDFHSGRNWERLLRFGVKGFIFVGAGNYYLTDAYDKVHTSEVSVPRYFVSEEDGRDLRREMDGGRRLPVRVSAEPSRWENRDLRSPWVLIPGADRELRSDIVVFTAPLDANNVVPALAFGAEAGANLYMLLELLDEFTAHPPARSVMLVAVNARTHNYLGDRILAWYLMAREQIIEELRNEVSDDLRLQELIADYMEKLRFQPDTRDEDEKFLIELRTLTDDSIGRQITIKDPIVSRSQRDVNEIKVKQLQFHRETVRLRGITNRLAEVKREVPDLREREAAAREIEEAASRIAEIEEKSAFLEERMQEHVNVLTLFNRVGIQTKLSDLTEVEEGLLHRYVDDIIRHNRGAAIKNRFDLERSESNSDIRFALGGRDVSAVISLEMVWDSPFIGFSSGEREGGTWATRWGRNTVRIAQELEEEDGDGNRANLLVDTLTRVGGMPEIYYVPNFSRSTAYLQRARRRPAFSLNNAFGSTGRSFTPADTLELLNTDYVAEISAFSRVFFRHVLADSIITGSEELPPPRVPDNMWSVFVKAYKFDEFAAGVLPELPVPGSAIILTPPDMPESGFSAPGIVATYWHLSDERATGLFYGIYEPLLSSSAFAFEDDFVTVTHSVDAGETHEKTSTDIRVSKSRILSLTAGEEMVVRERADAAGVRASSIYVRSYLPLSAARDSAPRRYGITGATSALSDKIMPDFSWGPAGFYLQTGERLKLLTANKRLAIRSTDMAPDGEGYLASEMGPDFFRHAVHDMDRLNRHRFAELPGVADELVLDFLDRGRRAGDLAEAAAAENDHLGYLRALNEGMGAQVKAYAQVSSITNDMLTAVVFYMALLLPFCFFVQKLLFKAVGIEWQMLLFFVFFCACYVLFRFIHPAFRVAQAPEAMFIAFVMGGLGMFVIYILHGRFEGEMQLLFHSMTGYEDAEVGYSMVSQQAMLIGVSNMKRRRIRTVLTTATIVLVTFTMLAFTSVSRRMSPTMIAQDRDPVYTGIMYHWPAAHKMDEATWNTMRQLYSGRADTFTRRWLKPPSGSNFRLVSEKDRLARIEGVLGLEPGEDGLLGPMPLVAGRFFLEPDAEEVIVAASVAEVLRLDPERLGEQTLEFQGRPLRVVGILDDLRLHAVEDINGISILPIAEMLLPDTTSAADDDLGAADELVQGAFHMQTSSLLIMPVETARRFGAKPYSISVRFEEDEGIWPVVDQLLTATSARFFVSSLIPFTAGGEGRRVNEPGVYYLGAGYRTSIGGLAMLIIPLLIASTIILNTMLGSVFERKKEIAVFNAVGLNPTHIGLFFLAESFVYGIIGSVGGYLVGQILSIVLNRYGLVEEVNLNFSSLGVAYVIVFTISIVLLSTLYPAIVATKAAVPSGQRKWAMPEHDGRVMKVLFPFIYQPQIAAGVMAYIDEYFSRFTEASTGDLIAERRAVELDADSAGRPVYRVTYHAALAPFDLGVTQTVVFTAAYDETVDAYQVVMTVTRVSGQDTNWATTNKPFLERLRKLLLQWRNMKPAEHGVYVRNGNVIFAEESHGQ